MRCSIGICVLVLAAAGCSSDGQTAASEAASTLGLQTQVPAEVTLLAERDGRYLDVEVDTRRSKLRFFFPTDATCRSVVAGEGKPTYSNQGPYGRLHLGGAFCDPIGLLALPAWQKRRPRQASGANPIPRGTARYEIVYSDEEVFMAHGRFPLAGLIGWSGGYDTIAIFPNVPECDGLLTKGSASMEYRDGGKQPLVLLDNRQRCPFLGFAMPGA